MTDSHIKFSVHDPDHDLTRVRLAHEVARPRLGPDFLRFPTRSGWELLLPRPEADRVEYQLEINHGNGNSELICDPTNPLRAPGPFGDKSVVEMPEYAPPAWVGSEPEARGNVTSFEVRSRALRARMRASLWSSPGTDPAEPLPLLVVHDGSDYANYSSLTHFLDHCAVARELPPMRAALLDPVDRDQIYSASATYARALAHDLLPQLAEIAPTPHGRSARVGMGASLGALAMLHAHRRTPALFGGLFLQSGSYFRPRVDRYEEGFVRFRRVARFTRELTSRQPENAHPIAITMTCGTAEENLANNVITRDALEAQGYTVTLVEHRDAHNWVSWRDTLYPHLVDLLKGLWS
ncbi:MAG TPA: alpha/beta hydrolase-fold protein [Actinomycetota bacterium]|nr:alpha/beta hydrolase-fold protein [Actinomycetota bacterium]